MENACWGGLEKKDAKDFPLEDFQSRSSGEGQHMKVCRDDISQMDWEHPTVCGMLEKVAMERKICECLIMPWPQKSFLVKHQNLVRVISETQSTQLHYHFANLKDTKWSMLCLLHVVKDFQ